MRWARILCVGLMSLIFCGPSRAGDEEVIAPYLNSMTGVVIRVDMTQFDPDALHSLEATALKAATGDKRLLAHGGALFDDMGRNFKRWLDGYRQAGGKQLYVVVNPVDAEPLVIVPIEAGVDGETLRRAMQMNDEPVPAKANRFQEGAKVAGKVVLFGRFSTMESYEKAGRVDRSDLLKLLATAPAGSAQFAIEATEDVQKFLLSNMPPQLPAALGGGKTADLVAAFRGASGSVSFPPHAKIELTIRSTSPQGAESIKSLIVAALNMIPGKPQALIEFLTPEIEGADLKLSRETAAVEEKLAPAAALAVVKSHEQYLVDESLMYLRLLYSGVKMYDNYQNKYPDEMTPASIGQYLGDEKSGKVYFSNPRHPDLTPGYIYVKPKDKPLAETIVIYEAPDPKNPDEEVCVCFGDGHTEKLSAADFNARMGKRNGQ